ncbi:transposable element Tcb2 transposase [Trichonephila clavipes]|nr:transposable element Tcb2 transposase [Trichonephila clavipes]
MSFTERPNSERPRQTSRREDRHIIRNVHVQPTVSSVAIQAQVAPSLEAPVSYRTKRKRLAERYLGYRYQLRALHLTPIHLHLYLEWCHARGNWTAAESNQIVLSDESRFNLRAGVMVCGDIAYNTRSPPVLIRSTMTAQQYVHDILQPHVLPLMQQLPGAIFEQDNVRPYTARVSQDCLRSFTALPWPSRSPDLSPIEPT